MLRDLWRLMNRIWTEDPKTIGQGDSKLVETNDRVVEAIQPNAIILPINTYIKLGRYYMPKRKWRRWRGRTRSALRA